MSVPGNQDEAAKECAGDRADRPAKVDVADRAAGLLGLLDGHLGDDRPDHSQHGRRDQEVERDHEDRPQLPGNQFRRRDQMPDIGVHPERTERQKRPQGEQRTDRPPRFDAIGQPPPSTFPRQMPPRMIPITLVQTVNDEPT